jgi:hypothetical protein
MNIDWSDVIDYQMHPECRVSLESDGVFRKICGLCIKRFWYEVGTEYGQIKPSRLSTANEEAGRIAS